MKKLFLITLWALSAALPAQESARDVMLVLDNSGSMRENDPEFLAKTAVEQFVGGLEGETRVGVIIFDQKVRLAVPLTELTSGGRERILASLERIDYRGQLTDSPSAMERAIYELKTSGREGARRLVVFMTDGIVDTGSAELDVEKTRWLRTELAAGAAEAGIRIFSVAFTDNADFFLTQSLAQKTGGDYFRAPTPQDLAGVFEAIDEAIAAPPPEAAAPEAEGPETEAPAPPVQTQPQPVREPAPAPARAAPPPATPTSLVPGVDNTLLLGAGALALLLLAILVVLLARRRAPAATPASSYVPKAYLNDSNGITSEPAYELGAKPVMLGRVAGSDAALEYIVIQQNTVGRRHALVEYRDFSYWITDQGSVNGTFVNDNRIDGPTRLKHGDRVRLHNFEFEFAMPELADTGQTVFSGAPGDDGIERTVMAAAPAAAAAAQPRAGEDTAEVAAEPGAGAHAGEVGLDVTGAPPGDAAPPEPLLVIGDEEDEEPPSQDELDARFEEMFSEQAEEAGEPEDAGAGGLKTVMPSPLPGGELEGFHEAETMMRDEPANAGPSEAGPPADEDAAGLDSFIDTRAMQAGEPAQPSAPEPAEIGSEDPTITPPQSSAYTRAPAQEEEGEGAPAPFEALAGDGAPEGVDDPPADADISLDEFIDSAVFEEDEDATEILPDEPEAPESEDPERTVLPSQVEDDDANKR